LIPRNTKIPVRREHAFTTQRDGQTQARMTVLQGDHPQASENIRLGEIVLGNLRGDERFQSKIQVAFEIDASGMLHVKALDEDSGDEKEIVIRNSFNPDHEDQDGVLEEQASLEPVDGATNPAISGPFRETELVDVLCFLHANRKSGRIMVHTSDQNGSLVMANGEITHAECADSSGTDAVQELLRLNQGHFAFHEGFSTSDPAEIKLAFNSLIGAP